MKRIKIIIIMMLLISTTGCSVEYNLNIDKDTAKEEVIAIFENTDENKKLTNRLYKNRRSSYYDEDKNQSFYYDITKEEDKKNNKLKLYYNYDYPLQKLKYSNAVAECFYNKTVVKDQKYITINTSEGVNCIYRDIEKQIDELVVNIKTNYELIETNADVIENNTYTWNITDDNYQEKSIYLKIDYTKEQENKSIINEKIVAIFLLIFIILAVTIILYFKLRSNKKYK